MNHSNPALNADLSRNLLRHHRFVGRIGFFYNSYISLKTGLWCLDMDCYTRLKRATDVTVAGVMLLLLAPLLLLTALAIRLESPGPVLFHQIRIGYRGRAFKFWKFRSMYRDAERCRRLLEQANEMQGGVLFKMKKDPRVTVIGRFIRKFSIDELPQLWNVLVGDMSLVGPRPALPGEVARYSLHDRGRLDAAPGITCIWQVSGRSNIPFEQQVKLDLRYICFQSIKQDLKIMLQTVPAVLTGRGAY